MADDTDDDASARASGDAMAAQVAMNAPHSPAADAYLRKHSRLLDLQIENLEKQEHYEVSHLRWRRFNDQMRGALQIMVVLVAALGVIAIGAAVWSAANDNGLVIESFSVPPDMAGRGLTGDVVAARLLDKLSKLQAQTASARAASSYANNWGGDVKVQIPDTGVSIGQVYDYLTDWLGHQTHISGEVTRGVSGTIAVTARVGADASPDITGSEADFDRLLQQAAEKIYGKTQPYRYATYLSSHGRTAEAESAYRALIANGSPTDRAWAYVGLSTVYQSRGDIWGAIGLLRASLKVRPDFNMAYQNLVSQESTLQHDEAAYQAARQIKERENSGDAQSDMNRRAFALSKIENDGGLASALGDFQGEIAFDRQAIQSDDLAGFTGNLRLNDLTAYGFLHDGAGLRAALAALPVMHDVNDALNLNASLLTADYALGHWAAVQRDITALNGELASFGKLGDNFRNRVMIPLQAGAEAENGDFASADTRIANTPADCDVCIRLRGRIAESERRWGVSAHWFALLSARAPSIPFPDSDWGQMLLAKGDTAAAITKFESAHAKGPHFADPLEMWGEALMTQNRSDLAVEKFAEAAKYAPNWGRLHLKWGEALGYAGKTDEARTQFAIASGLDLSDAEKIELAHSRK